MAVCFTEILACNMYIKMESGHTIQLGYTSLADAKEMATYYLVNMEEYFCEICTKPDIVLCEVKRI